MSNDHLFSAQAPRFKVGCGGIDLFMGGFSFLNVNYLVQKFQKILQAAPAMAFDLALSTLCQQCSNIMKSLEALANELQRPPDERLPRREGAFREARVALHGQPEDQGRGAAGLLPGDGAHRHLQRHSAGGQVEWRPAHGIERDAHVQRLSRRDNQPVHDPGAKRLLRRGRGQGDTVEPRGTRERLYRGHPVSIPLSTRRGTIPS